MQAIKVENLFTCMLISWCWFIGHACRGNMGQHLPLINAYPDVQHLLLLEENPLQTPTHTLKMLRILRMSHLSSCALSVQLLWTAIIWKPPALTQGPASVSEKSLPTRSGPADLAGTRGQINAALMLRFILTRLSFCCMTWLYSTCRNRYLRFINSPVKVTTVSLWKIFLPRVLPSQQVDGCGPETSVDAWLSDFGHTIWGWSQPPEPCSMFWQTLDLVTDGSS